MMILNWRFDKKKQF